MHIWIDADACPAVIKDILLRAAERWKTPVTLVANQMLRTPPFALIRALLVSRGFDVADDYIVAHAAKGDLVITVDIPLAAEALAKGAQVVNPLGEQYSTETISERLTLRDMMEKLHSAGIETGRPARLRTGRAARLCELPGLADGQAGSSLSNADAGRHPLPEHDSMAQSRHQGCVPRCHYIQEVLKCLTVSRIPIALSMSAS
jgi:uncharacterized protein